MDPVVSVWQNIPCRVHRQHVVHHLGYIVCSVPQGSVLGPLLFIVYTADPAAIAEKHDVSRHAFADDTQQHLRCRRTDTASAAARLKQCIADVGRWMCANRLKLNADKTELLWVGSRHSLSQQDCWLSVLQLGSDSIVARDYVRLLAVTLSSNLSFDRHVSIVMQRVQFLLVTSTSAILAFT